MVGYSNKTLILATSLIPAIMVTPTAVFAQDQLSAASAVDAEPDIVVTGIRKSITDATAIKRKQSAIVDGISAEDIGKFPDQNLAESLQRITGVQITRSRGEGSQVNIRGLSSDFSRVQYNGRTVGSGGGRSFDFQLLSAEFISGVEVFKTPTADMIEGGLAGTVNVRTARALEIGKTAVTASIEGVYEQNSEKTTPRASALLNYVNKNHTFGINAGIGYEKRKYLIGAYQGYGAETGTESNRNPILDYNRDGDVLDTFTFDHGNAAQLRQGTRERLTAVGGFQFKPTSNVEIYGDALYSRFTDDSVRYENGVRFTNIAPAKVGDPYGITASTIDVSFNDQLLGGSQGYLSSVSAQGLDYRSTVFDNFTKNQLGSGAVGVKINHGRLKVNVEASLTKAKAPDGYFFVSTISRVTGTTSRPNGLGGLPLVEFGTGFDRGSTENFNLVSATFNRTERNDTNRDIRIDATYGFDSSILSSIVAGIYHGRRVLKNVGYQSSVNADTIARLSNGRFSYNPDIEGGSFSSSPIMTKVDFSGYVPGFPSEIVVPSSQALTSVVSKEAMLGAAPYLRQLGAGYNVSEKITAIYAMSNFDADAVSGNIGVRYVDTKLVSSGDAPDLESVVIEPGGVLSTIGRAESISISNSYNYFLPSLNLKFDVAKNLVIRGALARVLGRPSLDQVSAGTSVNPNVRTISSGNPSLKPYLSDQADISLEYYLPGGGIMSAAGFYKHLTNYVVSGLQAENHTVTFRGTNATQVLPFLRTLPVNSASIDLKGIEIGAQVPFTFLPYPLDGFGAGGSFTYIDAPKVPTAQGQPALRVPGVSKFAYTMAGYYEMRGFGVRGSYTWRDSFTGGDDNNFGDNAITRVYGQLDASISYNISEHFSLSADVSNLLNEKTKIDNNFGLLRQYVNVGRRVTAGIRVKM